MVSESPDSKDSTYINPGNNLSIRFKVSEPLAALDIYMNAVNRGRYPTVADDAITITNLRSGMVHLKNGKRYGR